MRTRNPVQFVSLIFQLFFLSFFSSKYLKRASAAGSSCPTFYPMLTALLSFASTAVVPAVMITHYSDAQCPCSARTPQDMLQHFLNSSAFDGLVDFQQFFVGDLTKNVHKCIHGEGECVAQRHFACAQNMSAPAYRTSAAWLDFEACSYGTCTDCAAIEGEHCPCYNYTVFNEYTKNNIMEECAARVGLDWTALHACGIGPLGDALMAASATRSNSDGITYGVDGLAPIYIDGQKVKTKELIPIVCGPTPKEIHVVVCEALAAKGHQPAACQ